MSKVYVLLDGDKIVRCEGGYSIANIQNISDWVLIDEGEGDRYNLCQSCYFEGGLYTEDGICRYKLVNGQPQERTAEEMDADRPAPPEPEESTEDLTLELIADHEYRLCLLELGITEMI